MTPLQIVNLLLDLGKTIASLCGADYDEVMAELAKRTAVDVTELDAAANEQDDPLE